MYHSSGLLQVYITIRFRLKDDAYLKRHWDWQHWTRWAIYHLKAHKDGTMYIVALWIGVRNVEVVSLIRV